MLRRFTPLLASLGVILFLNAASARYPRGEQMQAVKKFASYLKEDTAFLFKTAKEQRTQYNDVEQQVLDDLQELADSAVHFNDQINREFANPEHTEADYTKLKMSFAKASRDFPILRENDEIRAALKRTRETMASLTGYYEGTVEPSAPAPPATAPRVMVPPAPAAPGTTTKVTWTTEQYKSARDWSNQLREDTTQLYSYAQTQREHIKDFDDREMERLKSLSERAARFQEELKATDVPPERTYPEYREMVTTYSEVSRKFPSFPADEKTRVSIERTQKTFKGFNEYYGAFGKLPDVSKTTTTTTTTTTEEKR